MSNPPARQGHQTPHLLDQVAQGPIQPGLEHLQGWGIHNLSGQPVSAPHHSPGKELSPNIQPKSSLFQLKSVPPCPAVIYPFKEVIPFLFIGSLQVLKGCNEVQHGKVQGFALGPGEPQASIQAGSSSP